MIAWRDVQKLIDDFNDERVEKKRKQKKHKSAQNDPKTKENWDFYKVQQETYKQVDGEKLFPNTEKYTPRVVLPCILLHCYNRCSVMRIT